MSAIDMQTTYTEALARIGAQLPSEERRKPIFQRHPVVTEKQAITEAAAALRALWKPNTNR